MTQCVINAFAGTNHEGGNRMARKQEEPVQEGERRVSPLLAPLRKVLLASIGAVALAQDEAEDLINRLVERGELAREEGRKLVEDMMAKRQERVHAQFDSRIDAALGRMNVPSKADLRAVEKKLDELNQKLDKLAKS
jgi:polyhydroxyalkanoate synthesis regulator phasin